MVAAISILSLLALASALIALERGAWPLQRETPIHDQAYWQAVQADSAAYLAVHGKRVESQVSKSVVSLQTAAIQKLGGMAR